MSADPVAPPSDGFFTVGRRGYDPHQVDAHLRRMDAEIRILVADRDAAVDQSAQLGRELDEARQRSDRLRTQVRVMAGHPSDVQGMSERMRTMLRLAEDEVADMLRRADAEVAQRLAEADASAEKIRADAQREVAEFGDAARAEAERLTAAARRRHDETTAVWSSQRDALAAERAAAEQELARAAQEADHARSEAWAALAAQHAQVEEDFRIAMDQRRTEALAGVYAERAEAVAWVARSRDETTRQCRAELAEAEETARRIVVAAQQHAAELADLRGRVALQLYGTQEQLAEALAAMAPGRESMPQTPVLPRQVGAADDREPVTRPLPVSGPAPGTRPSDTPGDGTTHDTAHDTGGSPAAGEPAATRATPNQTSSLDGAARRTARRRKRRPATGATRR